LPSGSTLEKTRTTSSKRSAESISWCGTDDRGQTSATSRPSTMPSPTSTRPSGARGRRSSASALLVMSEHIWQQPWATTVAFAALVSAMCVGPRVAKRLKRERASIRVQARQSERTCVARELHDTALRGIHAVLLKLGTWTARRAERLRTKIDPVGKNHPSECSCASFLRGTIPTRLQLGHTRLLVVASEGPRKRWILFSPPMSE
jgi:hypothetical protein